MKSINLMNNVSINLRKNVGRFTSPQNLLHKCHIIDQKLESKTREQNELYEKCMRHMRVLHKKGMMGDFYYPKKRGITATPTKVFDGHYVPNFIPFIS